ncbi:MAG: oxidative damage protection protein [Achromobacter sp.]|jgi:Fe-S cluster biosynthesis and repair protein YggX
MTRTVQCVKLKREAEGLDFAPYPGEMGTRIWQSISKEAWEEWKSVQTRLVNENRLNLADSRARKYLKEQMERFLFEDGSVEADGYVPPSA